MLTINNDSNSNNQANSNIVWQLISRWLNLDKVAVDYRRRHSSVDTEKTFLLPAVQAKTLGRIAPSKNESLTLPSSINRSISTPNFIPKSTK